MRKFTQAASLVCVALGLAVGEPAAQVLPEVTTLRMNVETPKPGSVTLPFRVAGWALDLASGGWSGVDAVHVWAFPTSEVSLPDSEMTLPAQPDDAMGIFLGVADRGLASEDVAAVFGPQFGNARFSLQVTTQLYPGRFVIGVYARRASSGLFEAQIGVAIEVRPVSLSDLKCRADQVPLYDGYMWVCSDPPRGPRGAMGPVGPQGPPGPSAPVTGEAGVLRIGTAGTHTKAFVAGVSGVTTAGPAVPVLIDANGQLGTASSSRRFKDEIRDMGDASTGLMDLRPVTFRYKPEVAAGERPVQFGLIAEEVAQVFPGLVQYSPDGEPNTVLYQFLAPMLLNELQKQQRRIADQEALISDLAARLAALEAAVASERRSGGSPR